MICAFRKDPPSWTHLIEIVEEMNLARGKIIQFDTDKACNVIKPYSPSAEENPFRADKNIHCLLRGYVTEPA